MGKIILDFGDGWNARFLESVYKNNDYEAGSMADDMIRIKLKEAIFTDESDKPKWILCSERLPKKSGDYLTTIAFDLCETESGTATTREVYKNYFSTLSQKWLTDNEDVTAWMLAPEPYEEKEN